MLRLLDLIADCRVERAKVPIKSLSDIIAVVDEIIKARMDLNLLSKLVGFPRACGRHLRSAITGAAKCVTACLPPRRGPEHP